MLPAYRREKQYVVDRWNEPQVELKKKKSTTFHFSNYVVLLKPYSLQYHTPNSVISFINPLCLPWQSLLLGELKE